MKDVVRYHPVPGMPGMVLGQARITEFQFDRHYHVDYHIGLVTQGVQRQSFRGRSVLLGPGAVALMPPGEIHDGAGVSDYGLSHTLQTFRIAPELMRGFLREVAGGAGEERFLATLIEDAGLAQRLMALHGAWMSDASATPMARDEASLAVMAALFARSGGGAARGQGRSVGRAPPPCAGLLPGAPEREDRPGRPGGAMRPEPLPVLAPLRAFLRLTPHAWLVRLRLERACAALAGSGLSVAQVAAEVGFYDQSHFNRAFRVAYGAPPSAYQPGGAA